ncbi:ATP-binding protein [Halovivax gelatinilyticus]|uniref:ATP-binding protein n=1 Tax=Halovivax gelatinilyticus TaxID=2961597 RepID=UPI0020CA3CA1|nr:ATP-binding protein [Halovivax gelatinilyticus]
MKKAPKVNEVNEFLEIASDFEDPLEVIRESLSNSYDANASNIEIEIKSREMGSDIIIDDDGDGMDLRDLESFFDLGNSRKTDSIGYKGHGTKIFYKSDEIVVNTVHDGTNLRAVMSDPWKKLNNRVLPEYEVTETPVSNLHKGTRIRIHNFRSGQGFDPESLTYNKIEHYLKWKTIAGSTAHMFEDDQHEMDITVRLGDEIDDSYPEVETKNRLEFPNEQLEPDYSSDFPAERMCKHYGPTEVEADYDGGTTTLHITGMVGGKAARNELPTYGKHSAQFGVWLAKDHIKVERLNEAISHDNEFLHFFFVVNCQDIELSANRETIRNKSSPVFQALKEATEFHLSKVAQDPWFKEYLEIRREAEIKRRARNRRASLKLRRERVESGDSGEPSNRTEVLLTLARENENTLPGQISVEDYEPDSDVHAIARQNGKLRNAAVHCSLTNHFNEELTFEEVDLIICWDHGDPVVLREYERQGYLGEDIEIDLEENGLLYGDENPTYVEILPLSHHIEPMSPRAVADD